MLASFRRRFLWLPIPVCVCLTCLAPLFRSASALAQPPSGTVPPHCILVLVPGLRADDLARPELPGLRTLLQEGAGGWMVCRSALSAPKSVRPDPEKETASLLLTLGSGA